MIRANTLGSLLMLMLISIGLEGCDPETIRLKVEPPKLSKAMLAVAQDSAESSEAVLEEIINQRISLLPPVTPPDLNLNIADGLIQSYSTDANYYVEAPRCEGEDLDFTIAAAVNFGLRGYILDSEQCIRREVGDYDTAYYSVAVDQQRGLLAFSVPGHARIDIYDLGSFLPLESIVGFSATALAFHEGRLFFGGYPADGSWEEASIFSADTDRFEVSEEFLAHQLADVRGIAFLDGVAAISDGYHNRVIVADDRMFVPRTVYEGFNYPNGVSFDQQGNLLVADEHHGLVHRVNRDGNIVWSSPPYQLISPGSVVEISEGRYEGHYLIADADGNRIILVDPANWEIKFEVAGTRSVMKALPIY